MKKLEMATKMSKKRGIEVSGIKVLSIFFVILGFLIFIFSLGMPILFSGEYLIVGLIFAFGGAWFNKAYGKEKEIKNGLR